MKNFLLINLFLLLFLTRFEVKSQSLGFDMPNGRGKIDIPFEYYNNFILLKIEFNNSFPLKFIFDTGAEHTILTKREITDLLALPYGRTFNVVGSDVQKTLTAHLVKGVSLKTGHAEAPQQDILVLDEDYFRFEEFTGTEVHGILGADLFRRFVVKINYQRRVISLYNPVYYQTPNLDKYKEVDIIIHRSKPYLESQIYMQSTDSVNCKLLLDTGASLALLLNTYSHPNLSIPPNVIKSNVGSGLGGFIEGYIGRVGAIDVAGTLLTNVTTSFQDAAIIKTTQDSLFRNGIIGNEILNRFSIIINYPLHKLYIKPTRKIKQKFVYDKSGLTLITAGAQKSTLIVQNVLPNSPAAKAGIIKGDIVRAINGLPASFLSLKNASNMLRKKTGKTIKMRLERLGYPIKRSFILEDLI